MWTTFMVNRRGTSGWVCEYGDGIFGFHRRQEMFDHLSDSKV
jgi:hypothetical protein